MGRKVLSIQTGIWWTKVALIEYGVKHPHVFDVFTFRTPENAVEDGYIREREALSNQLRAELSKRRITEKRVIFSINSAKVVSREVMIPKVSSRQLKSIAIEQARESFPMDIASYTISYTTMGMLDGDPKQQMKLLLLAVPDNLLANYINFAELCGLDIETFEYMGNCAMQFIAKNYIEDSVIVQLEERSTIVSIVKDNKLVFQRVAPHGYDSTLITAIDHPVLGLREDQEAFEFLCNNNVTRDKIRPDMFNDSVIVDPDERMAAIQQAYEAIKESMDYHVRIVVSALEFYQNQYKTPLRGTLHLIGDGMRIQGMARYFDTKINIEVEKGDYMSLVKMDRKVVGNTLVAGESLGLLSIFGAVLEPMGITPKEMAEKMNRRNSAQWAGLFFLVAAGASAILLGIGFYQKMSAENRRNYLESEIERLSPVEEIYNENKQMRSLLSEYEDFHLATNNASSQARKLTDDLEVLLPSNSQVHEYAISNSEVVLKMSTDTKMSAAQILIGLKALDYINNVEIPSLDRAVQSEKDAEGNTTLDYFTWEFSVNIQLKNAPLNDYIVE